MNRNKYMKVIIYAFSPFSKIPLYSHAFRDIFSLLITIVHLIVNLSISRQTESQKCDKINSLKDNLIELFKVDKKH